jgi:hypothetical protein
MCHHSPTISQIINGKIDKPRRELKQRYTASGLPIFYAIQDSCRPPGIRVQKGAYTESWRHGRPQAWERGALAPPGKSENNEMQGIN